MPRIRKVTAGSDDYRPHFLHQDANLQLERRENVLVVTTPGRRVPFNPDRPSICCQSTLGPFTRVAKSARPAKMLVPLPTTPQSIIRSGGCD